MGCHGFRHFDPGNGRSTAENSRPICETYNCFFITAIQSYSSTQLYSTYMLKSYNHCFVLMNTSILPPVYTTMPYLGQPGLVFRGVDVSILLHGLRLIILFKIKLIGIWCGFNNHPGCKRDQTEKTSMKFG